MWAAIKSMYKNSFNSVFCHLHLYNIWSIMYSLYVHIRNRSSDHIIYIYTCKHLSLRSIMSIPSVSLVYSLSWYIYSVDMIHHYLVAPKQIISCVVNSHSGVIYSLSPLLLFFCGLAPGKDFDFALKYFSCLA